MKDSALVILAAATLAATTTSPTFDLAFNNQLVLGQFNPGAGGAAMQLVVPVISYESDYEVNLLGTPSGGTYTLTINTQGTSTTTAGIAFNASAQSIQTALATTLNTASSNITVEGSIIRFAPSLGVLSMTGNGSGLTGTGTGVVAVSAQTYSFQMFSSPDGVNWSQASRVASVSSDSIPPGGYTILIDFTAPARYLQLVVTISTPAGDFPASIVLGDCYLSPTVNRFG